MNEIIQKRKSIRKYDPAPLDSIILDEVRGQIDKLKPLFPDIRYKISIANKTKGMLNVKAPHYLLFGSEDKEGAYENIGFVGQQMDLYFSGAGLGSCWLGMAKPEDKEASDLPHVICMSFGKPAEPLHRGLSEFKRKPVAAISEGADERLEAVRLAPSGVNFQNWYFIAGNGKIHCYRKKPTPLIGSAFGKLGCIDLGIAICHIAVESESFSYKKENDAPFKKGYVYMGTVQG